MSGGALCQAPLMSPAALRFLRTPQFPPFSPSGPYNAMSLGFGMAFCSIRPPLLSSLSPLQATSLLPMPTLNPIPQYRSPSRMHYMPFASSLEFPASVVTASHSKPKFTGRVVQFNRSSRNWLPRDAFSHCR